MTTMRAFTTMAGILLCASLASASPASQREYRFSVFLDDKEIGHHHFEVIQEGQLGVVRSNAEFAVRIFFVTAYSYRHSNEEHWDGSCLRRIHSTTDDNGERLHVTGEVRGEALRVASPDGQAVLDGCVRTFAYWDPEKVLAASRLLNAQTGEYIPVTVTDLGFGPTGDRESRRIRIEGEKLAIDLWYSRDNDWLALETTTKNGARLRYRLDQERVAHPL